MCKIKDLIKQIKEKKRVKCYDDCIKPKLKNSTVSAIREFMKDIMQQKLVVVMLDPVIEKYLLKTKWFNIIKRED